VRNRTIRACNCNRADIGPYDTPTDITALWTSAGHWYEVGLPKTYRRLLDEHREQPFTGNRTSANVIGPMTCQFASADLVKLICHGLFDAF
jgi:hypothetical protein